jgi:titin
VGGTAAGARNVISGNVFHGVLIKGGAASNLVLGNFIGTDAAGAADLGNGTGVAVSDGANNFIGGTSAAARNVISGNDNDGVKLLGVGSTGNKVLGNFIGLNAAGNVVGNSSDGVDISNGAANNIVGGAVAGARNVISGNGVNGVKIQGVGTTGNQVLGNFIGLNAAGTADLGNTGDGVEINAGAANNTIGGTSVLARNVISGNGVNGVLITDAGSTGNKVLGNFIGLNAAGDGGLNNSSGGVEISTGAANNTVGGTSAGARNVISGNTNNGILIAGAGTTGNNVQGNFIGLNSAGAADLGNSTSGVEIFAGAANNTVGGTTAAARNVISGNTTNGILISGAGTTGNSVQGNFIGLNAAGTAALGNGQKGVRIRDGAANNAVGGAVAGARNVIAGNSTGVGIETGANANVLVGNFIGTNAAGNADLGNNGSGVEIGSGAANNTVGGATTLARNIISGNAAHGVQILGSDTNANKVQGNFIGLAANGTSPLGNDQNGVFIAQSAANNSIGGTAAGAGNVIAHNGGDGVLIGGNASFPTPAGTGNSVQGNSIFANGESGIDLGADDGVTANDANDPDTGPNDLLNKPVLTGAFLVGDVLLIGGTINTELGKTLLIELFSTPTLNAAGQAEGKTFLGFVTVTTSASNTVGFSTFLQTTKAKLGDLITATATDELGNTSEFSLGVTVV